MVDQKNVCGHFFSIQRVMQVVSHWYCSESEWETKLTKSQNSFDVFLYCTDNRSFIVLTWVVQWVRVMVVNISTKNANTHINGQMKVTHMTSPEQESRVCQSPPQVFLLVFCVHSQHLGLCQCRHMLSCIHKM